MLNNRKPPQTILLCKWTGKAGRYLCRFDGKVSRESSSSMSLYFISNWTKSIYMIMKWQSIDISILKEKVYLLLPKNFWKKNESIMTEMMALIEQIRENEISVMDISLFWREYRLTITESLVMLCMQIQLNKSINDILFHFIQTNKN